MRYLTVRPNRVAGTLPEFPRTVDDLFHRFWNGATSPQSRGAWEPSVDVIETPQAYVLRAEIAGIDPKDVDVTLVGDTLTIRGEKLAEEMTEEQTLHLRERGAGRFERVFTLPTPVSESDIEAEARHGILTIKVMKAKESQPRRIDVREA